MTGKDHDSLGVAIQELKPGTNGTAVKTAEREADADAKAAASQSSARLSDQKGGD